jgi:hypothetical protein
VHAVAVAVHVLVCRGPYFDVGTERALLGRCGAKTAASGEAPFGVRTLMATPNPHILGNKGSPCESANQHGLE